MSASVPHLASSEATPRSTGAAHATGKAPLGRGLRNRSRDCTTAAPPAEAALGSLSAPATHAALASFVRGEAARATIRRRACIAAAFVAAALLTFGALAVPRVPAVSVSKKSASTTSTRESVVLGSFGIAASATINVDNTANFFPMAFKEVVVTLAGADGVPFASWADDADALHTAPARGQRAFVVSASFDTLTNPAAVINTMSALRYAIALTQNASTTTVLSSASVFATAAMTPIWLSARLPRTTIAFALPVELPSP
jgi:hypothetical protein